MRCLLRNNALSWRKLLCNREWMEEDNHCWISRCHTQLNKYMETHNHPQSHMCMYTHTYHTLKQHRYFWAFSRYPVHVSSLPVCGCPLAMLDTWYMSWRILVVFFFNCHKYCEPKPIRARKDLFNLKYYIPSSRELKTQNWKQELKQKSEISTAGLL